MCSSSVNLHLALAARRRLRIPFGSEPPHGGVAQLGEHLLCKQGVGGSNPLTSTTQTTDVR